jgi:hypothetical protein
MSSLEAYGRTRDELRSRLRASLIADPRVVAAWLTGSFGRDEADEWSDLDLHVAVEDDALAALSGRDSALFPLVGDPALVQAGFPSDCMPGGTFWLVVYEGAVHVDWNIGPAGATARSSASVLLFEHRPIPLFPKPEAADPLRVREDAQRAIEFFWAMAPIALKYAGRGHTRLAITQSALLERAYVALWNAVHEPQRLYDKYHQNRKMQSELDATFPRFGPNIDGAAAVAVIRSFCDLVEALHPALAAAGVAVPERMPAEVRRLSQIAEAEAARGGSRPGTGSRR